MNLFYLALFSPLISFFLLSFSRGLWSEHLTTKIVISSLGLLTLIIFWITWEFFNIQNDNLIIFNKTIWNWIIIDEFYIPIAFHIDNLSLSMLIIISSIGFLIHIYAAWYMHDEDGYSRFFAYTSLFIFSMLILVLADNLLFMYLGWEMVGLCSYLLIGFHYKKLNHITAATKAFIMTRIGDVLLLIALFIIYDQLGTLNFNELIVLAPQKISENSTIINCIVIMLLGGAVGKSAQLPLQTWLLDAMAGPTPVSALIHAATMVVAGVYLIARTYSLFLMAPEILFIIEIIGATTMILAGLSALVQIDIKKILACSTMSQVSYMFLALSIKSYDLAMFHLMTHAFFKALLFISAGSVIKACKYEQNIFKMGGLRKSMPLVYSCFLVGGSSLVALPLITAGFYSKDEILWHMFINGHNTLMIIGLLGSFITSLYIFRMIFVVFHGKTKFNISCLYDIKHHLPLIILLILSTFIGAWMIQPLISTMSSNTIVKYTNKNKLMLELFSSVITVMGIFIANSLWLGKRKLINNLVESKIGKIFYFWWFYSWGFDWLYNKLFVKPYLYIAQLLNRDPIDRIINTSTILIQTISNTLILSVNGQIRWYITSILLGTICMIVILLFTF